MKKIGLILAALLVMPMLAIGFNVSRVGAQSSGGSTSGGSTATCDPAKDGIAQGANCAKGEGQRNKLFGDGSIFTAITNALLFLIGAISVIMLIYGGIRYTISGGDSAAVTAAKNTILYAIVGIVVALLAYAIVNFVVTRLAG